MKLLIGVPTSGQPTQPFLDALPLLALPPNVDADRVIWSGNAVAAQREMIARHAVSTGCDMLVMIDDDIVPPPDALIQLLAVLEDDARAAVVGALYYSRDSARPIVVADWDSSDTTTAHIPAFTSTSTDPVAAIGFGCALLRVSAARKAETPRISNS